MIHASNTYLNHIGHSEQEKIICRLARSRCGPCSYLKLSRTWAMKKNPNGSAVRRALHVECETLDVSAGLLVIACMTLVWWPVPPMLNLIGGKNMDRADYWDLRRLIPAAIEGASYRRGMWHCIDTGYMIRHRHQTFEAIVTLPPARPFGRCVFSLTGKV